MKVVFRVDASLLIGSGHVMRCLVLANELRRKGHEIRFACTPFTGDMRSFILERGFDILALPEPREVVKPAHDADYEAWLQKSVDEDADDFLRAVSAADLVITDHYAIGEQWQKRVKASLGCRLLAIDDLARHHRADLILDQTLGREQAAYAESKTRVLVGSEYALLQRGFSSLREAALGRALSKGRPKVLVSMGGIDAPNATLKVLESLCHPLIDAEITVLLSSRAPHFHKVKAWCALYSQVTHQEFVEDMASLMLAHDVAIGAPGTTSWERACLGLPSIIVPLAENQQLICQQLVKRHAALQVDIDVIPQRLADEYQKLLKQWSQIKDTNLALCDGRGARRVVFEIEQLLGEEKEGISLVRAFPEDIALIYEWQRHPETRKHALTPNIPTWDEHHGWMSRKLRSVTDYYYMVVERANEGQKVGAVRLDRMSPGHYLVSIFVDPQNYGKGIAYKALRAIDAIHPDVTLHATVLKANIASQRLFQKADYQQVDEETYIRQPID
ncbi:UDP-2,4-diacetamido-2,4,6-trideoxy-beta-L-altropyranose hydrolase [Vibrio cholerae]|uniref:UDP-2,4-diacetamido-2,4, 6-trideoxy-beta-L-altropyranose hydrolase n=1 Tax=Vibrio cholerae TaxID=666 RepID=UPI0018F07EC7|nr:UDP-2,4-diacetamido-2,4,6-trideoxy-beta-L-altropyranose hydrolase [Vibrio cholerae]EGR1102416.1 UDP-2,4-diacetamido-2,4,6-trideoxy-beta-L-altropyranose hydrolase [Vibrio cholerae]MBJ7018318.1 UDP-2,4-diacetamido-2,4,6-trideoxy-beta-L-altropyranose hydrolase [Vibrio cholerae]MDV2362296.1 UDP-2,4-diacetamido-2,4,6-trideoxy-beta-L-altropyranose hydrolase [Vibrio cholerae]